MVSSLLYTETLTLHLYINKHQFTCIYVHTKYTAGLKFMIIHFLTHPPQCHSYINMHIAMPVTLTAYLHAQCTYVHTYMSCIESLQGWVASFCAIFFAPVPCNGTLVATASDGKCIHEHSPTHAHTCIHMCDSNPLINLVIIVHNCTIKLAHTIKVSCICIDTTTLGL